MQVRANFIFHVEHPRQLAERHGIAHRHGKISHERQLVGVQHRPFDNFAAQRIWPVEHHKRNVVFRRCFHAIAHRRYVSVKAHACILNIKDQHIDALQHRIRWPARLSVKTVNRQPGRGVRCVRHNRSVCVSGDPVLRAKDCNQLYAVRFRQNINRPMALRINSGLVCNHSHAFTAQRSEVLLFEHVDSGLGVRVRLS